MKLLAFLAFAAVIVGDAWASDDRFCDVSPARPQIEIEPLHPVLNIPRPETIA
jgi:hypothetical protein